MFMRSIFFAQDSQITWSDIADWIIKELRNKTYSQKADMISI